MLLDIEPPSGDSVLKIVLGGLVTGFFGTIAAIIRFRNSKQQRDADRETSMRETGVAHSQDLTARMENLMGAYETHIKSLSDDLVNAKDEIRGLKLEIDRLKQGKTREWGEADAG